MKKNKILIIGLMVGAMLSLIGTFSNALAADCTNGHIGVIATTSTVKEATCTTTGIVWKNCTSCQQNWMEETAALGHSYAGAEKYNEVEPTCVYERLLLSRLY